VAELPQRYRTGDEESNRWGFGQNRGRAQDSTEDAYQARLAKSFRATGCTDAIGNDHHPLAGFAQAGSKPDNGIDIRATLSFQSNLGCILAKRGDQGKEVLNDMQPIIGSLVYREIPRQSEESESAVAGEMVTGKAVRQLPPHVRTLRWSEADPESGLWLKLLTPGLQLRSGRQFRRRCTSVHHRRLTRFSAVP
jgi:hypothetical protein